MLNTRSGAAARSLLSVLAVGSMLGCASMSGHNEASQNPRDEGVGNFTIGPEYKIDPDLTDKGNPKGKSFEFFMPLASSKIFPGNDTTLEPDKKPVREKRKISVYVPAAYKDGTKAPVLIIHDGPGQLGLVRNALDNLTIS